ncbi:MAG: TIGR00266 family protein [Candidatus Micrarchaeaceae archaeon]
MKFTIIGGDLQSLRIDLEKGESVYADSGTLVSKDSTVIMTPRAVGGLLGMLERKATGATALLTEFRARDGPGHMQVAGVFPGRIVPIELADGERFAAERFAFLAAEESVKFDIHITNLSGGLFGGTGFVLQNFTGPGKVFIHITGDMIIHNLDGTKEVEVDPSHVAGFDGTLSYKVRFVDNVKTAMFGGVGLFLATFSGRGRLITQTISRYKLAAELYSEGQEQVKGKSGR